MQIRTTVRYYFTPIIKTSIKNKTENKSVGEDVEE